ncbi:hypothetical protein [Streptomyces misionensis]|uniref:hypothetical protein n=1 Tax=Streptomyces misionensis TaxID=67331 RepID=UPI0036A7F66C
MSSDTTPPIIVKRVGAHIPITAEQMLDAGLPLPPGMEPPPPAPRPTRYQRLRWACRERIQAARERVGFWIAGYTPDDCNW